MYKALSALILSMAIFSTTKAADLSLDNDLSTIDFMSIKKGTVIEPHTFKKLSGTLTENGKLEIEIDLSSVDTKIEVRDERMKSVLFEVAKYGSATLVADLDDHSMDEGEIKLIEASATLDLHGVSKEVKIKAMAAKVGEKLMVTSADPIILNADDFGLATGLDTLQKIAQLPSITHSVPVSFVLVFK